jgi:cell division protein FtsL
MKKTFFILLIGIIICLSCFHVIVSNMLSTAGVELDDLQKKVTLYRKQNLLLREDMLENSSLYHVASAAASMGFVSEKSHVYFSAPLPLAKR